MEETRRSSGGRATLGIILVLVGSLFLLQSLNIIALNIPHIIFSPHFLIFIIGLLILINSRKKILGAILTIIGGVWLLPRVFPQIDIDSGIIVSVAIIGLGLFIILRTRNREYSPTTTYVTSEGHPDQREGRSGNQTIRNDYIDDVAVFGGGHRVVYSDNFKGGSITAIFGGSEIELTKCKLAEGDNVIDVLAIFGGAEVRVPRDWNVIVNATPVFGGFANKIVRDPSMPIDMSRTLIIKGLAIFGGIEINSKTS